MIIALDHLVLTVHDIDASAKWYERVCGMRRETVTGSDGTTRTALLFGSQKINLHQKGAEFAPHATAPTPGSGDLCFLLSVPLSEAQKHLADCSVPIEQGPVHRTGAIGPLQSIYIRDPDGNLIELSERL